MKTRLLILPLFAILSGCVSSQYEVKVTPDNARITVMGQPPAEVERVPGGAKVSLPSGDVAYTVSASLDGYQTGTYTITPGQKLSGPIVLDLARIAQTKAFTFRSDPAGATVVVDGRAMGKTPCTLELGFSRKDASSPWDSRSVRLELTDWQTESLTLGTGSASEVALGMSLLRQERSFTIKVQTQDGHALEAATVIEGVAEGVSPLSASLVFSRADKAAPWPLFRCRAWIADEYKEQSVTISRESPDVITLTLAPVTEMNVPLMAPKVVVGPRGAQLVVDEAERVAAVATGESSGTVTDLRPVTAYARGTHMKPQVNSFAVSQDGQSIVYALTETAPDGNVVSNLWQVSTSNASAAKQRLTSGAYIDCCPQLPRPLEGEENRLRLFFQSNRGIRESVDLSAIRLVDGRAVGGITQITREARFNFAPTIIREDMELFYISMEDHYPSAVSQISYMRTDGSTATYMTESADDLSLAPDGMQVYFSRKDGVTNTRQIFSIPIAGYPLTQVIAQQQFNDSNCFAPAINPEGNLMLFVSDMAKDKDGRRNNDIYLMNLENGRIVPLTTNISDDVEPQWSPSESGVVYFISNRGGSYNIWRMKLADVQ
jgi:succinate dehydrogenase flavin-adding protein (antitoxin of CptAB toxin-antitoxin module)